MKEQKTTLKVECYFTTYVTVDGDDRDNWEEQLDEKNISELIEECDKIIIDNWEEV